ncbi:ribokinase [Abyssisolibacter fermentans]|uniref:ribokinase n=1 Tax=Abyssisolibacter fermentans TaxID=1766203 RepID=UPI000831D3D6|nr:ribokinase [Abyssisolibacter fermentans]
MGKVMVLGSINMDLVTTTHRMPKIGETITGKTFKQVGGGKGANQACAIARLECPVSLAGCVGNDVFGKTLVNSLDNDGVDISKIKFIDKVSTGVATVLVDDSGDNCIVVISGANYCIEESDIKDIIEEKAYDVALAQLEVEMNLVEKFLIESKRNGKYTILNPAPAKKLSQELINNVDLLIPNETELEILTDIKINNFDDVIRGSKMLLEQGVVEVIVTLGDKGCVYVNNKKIKQYNAYKVNALDTTAAGDSFIGAIAVGKAQGMDIDEAIQTATKVSAITVTRSGAQSSIPTKKEVEEFEFK